MILGSHYSYDLPPTPQTDLFNSRLFWRLQKLVQKVEIKLIFCKINLNLTDRPYGKSLFKIPLPLFYWQQPPVLGTPNAP